MRSNELSCDDAYTLKNTSQKNINESSENESKLLGKITEYTLSKTYDLKTARAIEFSGSLSTKLNKLKSKFGF